VDAHGCPLHSYSSPTVDWRARYLEVADLLADTRNELDDFHHSSKELEEELERELERAEKTQQNLKLKASNAEQERDNWKVRLHGCMHCVSLVLTVVHARFSPSS
jgi:hypothetical protein